MQSKRGFVRFVCGTIPLRNLDFVFTCAPEVRRRNIRLAEKYYKFGCDLASPPKIWRLRGAD